MKPRGLGNLCSKPMIKIKKKKKESINTSTPSSNGKEPAHFYNYKGQGKRHLCSNLPHGVPVPQSCSVWGLVHGIEVDGDAESHTNLISPGIASSNGPRGIVDFVGDAILGQGFR